MKSQSASRRGLIRPRDYDVSIIMPYCYVKVVYYKDKSTDIAVIRGATRGR